MNEFLSPPVISRTLLDSLHKKKQHAYNKYRTALVEKMTLTSTPHRIIRTTLETKSTIWGWILDIGDDSLYPNLIIECTRTEERRAERLIPDITVDTILSKTHAVFGIDPTERDPITQHLTAWLVADRLMS